MISFDTHGAAEIWESIRRGMENLKRELQSSKTRAKVLKVAARELRSLEKRLFATGGTTGAHGKWTPYTPAEARWQAMKVRLGFSDRPFDWGPNSKLRQSLTDEHHKQHIEQIVSGKLKFGTTHPGPTRRRLNRKAFLRRGYGNAIPERRVVDPTDRQATTVMDTATDTWRKSLDDAVPDEFEGKA